MEEDNEKIQKRNKQMPWVEKYRPKGINELSHQEEIVKVLKGVLETGNLPHLLFYGPPGTGKTSAILALAKDLWGLEFYRERILELNASDDRGITVVREKIKKFAQTVPAKAPQHKQANYKIIILDEADLMTNNAQSALRRIIEDYSRTTRFCIICNYITKIITPLASRCIKYYFKPIPHSAQLAKLHQICEQEQLKVTSTQAIQTLIQLTQGDLRRSVTLLQSVSILQNKEIDEHKIQQISGMVPRLTVENLVEQARQAKGVEQLLKVIDQFLLQGYSAYQLLPQLLEIVVHAQWIDQINKTKTLILIAEVEAQLCLNARDDLQLYYLFSTMLLN